MAPTTTTTTTPGLTITHAQPPDFPPLALLLSLAVAPNPIERFMFRQDYHNPSAGEGLLAGPSAQWAMTQFAGSLQQQQQGEGPGKGPRTFVVKAVAEGGAMVGMAIVRVVDGGDGKAEGGGKVTDGDGEREKGSAWEDDAGEVLNGEFCEGYMTRLKDVYMEHMGGSRHAYWNALMVHPAWQRRGIGSAMIEWALKNLELDSMPTWLCAQPDGHALYLKYGWKDIENVDMDLGKWAGPNRGFGMHRTVCMLRGAHGA